MGVPGAVPWPTGTYSSSSELSPLRREVGGEERLEGGRGVWDGWATCCATWRFCRAVWRRLVVVDIVIDEMERDGRARRRWRG
jgi:hypothetical protein